MEIKSVGVVGLGLMGSGIVEVCAHHGLKVIAIEADGSTLEAGKARIEKSMKRGLEAGKLTAEQITQTNANLKFSITLDELSSCDLVIEAIVEKLAEKQDLFEKLDRITPKHAVLATNTSSLPIIEIASATTRPEQVIGLHFFNPVPVMKLVEIVRSIATSDATFEIAQNFGAQLNKQVIVAQDRAGFIVNFLLMPYLMGAVRLYESGHASKEDIDTGMKLGCGHPMGPLELIDYVGLDTTLYVCEVLFNEYGNPEYAPSPLLRRMVAAGKLGRKSGQGFYNY